MGHDWKSLDAMHRIRTLPESVSSPKLLNAHLFALVSKVQPSEAKQLLLVSKGR